MSILSYIIIFTFIGSIVSLIGGILLLYREKFTIKISHFLISFAAGTLLGTAFFDLLPEASELLEELKIGVNVFLWTLIGMIIFFLLERFVHWFHYHDAHPGGKDVKPTVPLIIIGDSVHNFIDGITIAATFLISIPLGIVTTFAVAAHEIPQEIGDFAILLHKGLSKKKVIFYNILSAFTALAGALLTFYLKDSIESLLPIILSLTAGFFIYIASSDLIPEIHHEKRKGFALFETLALILGVVIVYLLVSLLE